MYYIIYEYLISVSIGLFYNASSITDTLTFPSMSISQITEKQSLSTPGFSEHSSSHRSLGNIGIT